MEFAMDYWGNLETLLILRTSIIESTVVASNVYLLAGCSEVFHMGKNRFTFEPERWDITNQLEKLSHPCLQISLSSSSRSN